MINIQVSLLDLITALSDVMDMISSALNGHHKRVAYISNLIGQRMGLSPEQLDNLYIAALLHDCGGISLKERLDALQFDIVDPYTHSEIGYRLLMDYEHFKIPAQIIRYHHANWKKSSRNRNVNQIDHDVLVESYILNLSDRIDVLIDKKSEILGQSEIIKDKIVSETRIRFMPDAVQAFLEVSKSVAFWMDIVNIEKSLTTQNISIKDTFLDANDIFLVAELIRKIIDFRSRFTATHSSGVASVAEQIGKCAGLAENEQKKLKIAGYLHDLGKLAVPVEVLDKPGKLTPQEFNVIKTHTYYTYRTLQSIKGLEEINEIASFHHERLDGTGYPFALDSEKLSFNSRIMAVADIFTALTEDRPYRKGMSRDMCLDVMNKMAEDMAIDQKILNILEDNYQTIDNVRVEAQAAAVEQYSMNILSTKSKIINY